MSDHRTRRLQEILGQNAKVTLTGLASSLGLHPETVEALLEAERIPIRGGFVIGRAPSRVPSWVKAEKKDD